jgi:type IV pilus assembly protein PilE
MRKLSPLPGSCGFTLIELMIVVAVIGVLLAIGVPNYQEYLLRSKLTDAGSSLSQLRVTLEQYFQDNRTYDLAPAAPAGNCGVVVAARDSNYFTYACTTNVVRVPAVPLGQAYLITATGVVGTSTAGFTYTIDEANNRRTTSLPAGRGVTPANCWLTAKGQTC